MNKYASVDASATVDTETVAWLKYNLEWLNSITM